MLKNVHIFGGGSKGTGCDDIEYIGEDGKFHLLDGCKLPLKSAFLAGVKYTNNLAILSGGMDRKIDEKGVPYGPVIISNDVWKFNMEEKNVEKMGELNHSRVYHGMSFLDENKLLIVGGMKEDFDAIDLCTIYDVSSGMETTVKSLPSPVLGVTLVARKTPVAIGGMQCFTKGESATKICTAYNSETNEWEKLPDLPTSRVAHGAAVFNANTAENTSADNCNDCFFVCGGKNEEGKPILEPCFLDRRAAQNGWTELAALKTPIFAPSVFPLDERKIAVVGGISKGGIMQPSGEVLIYDHRNNSWIDGENHPTLQVPRYGALGLKL